MGAIPAAGLYHTIYRKLPPWVIKLPQQRVPCKEMALRPSNSRKYCIVKNHVASKTIKIN